LVAVTVGGTNAGDTGDTGDTGVTGVAEPTGAVLSAATAAKVAALKRSDDRQSKNALFMKSITGIISAREPRFCCAAIADHGATRAACRGAVLPDA
jgi:hypothetical protein